MRLFVNGEYVEAEETNENLAECHKALVRDCTKHRHWKEGLYTCDKDCFLYDRCLEADGGEE